MSYCEKAILENIVQFTKKTFAVDFCFNKFGSLDLPLIRRPLLQVILSKIILLNTYEKLPVPSHKVFLMRKNTTHNSIRMHKETIFPSLASTNWDWIEFNWITSFHELREKCPNREFFLVRIFMYSDWIQENAD